MRERSGTGRRRGVAGALSIAVLLSVTTVGGASAHPSQDKLQRDRHGGGVGAVVDDASVGFVPAVRWDGTAPPAGQAGELVYAGSGCTPASYAGVEATGRIVVVEQTRSDGAADPCPAATFAQRMALAEAAGATGLLHLRDEGVATGGNAISSSIPGLDVAFEDALALRELVVAQGATAQATLVEPAALAPEERISDAPCEDGVAAGTWDCDGIDLLSFVPLSEFEGDVDARAALGAGASDLWGWTDGETGDEYVIIGTTNGVAFFRVTDPTAPQFLGRMENPAALQLIWHDIKVHADHAFVVSESNPHGMRIIDLTQLRDVEEPTTFQPTATYPLAVAAHNVELNVDSGFAYIVGGNAALVVPDACLHGLHVVDVRDPASPTFAGCYAAEGGPGTGPRAAGLEDLSPFAYVHDAQCVNYHGPDDRFHDREICFTSAEDKVVVADVTDKLAPVTLGVVDYPMAAYTHQGWLTEDQGFLLVNDEADETTFGIATRTVVIDVRVLTDPRFHFGHSHETRSITHNNYTVGDLVFQSNYTSGLRVLDVSAVAQRPAVDDLAEVTEDDGSPLREVAFFDTFPAHGEATFDGTWSNYPFFGSGTIAVSGIDEGLFLLRLQDAVTDPPVDGGEADGRRGPPADCARCPDQVPPKRPEQPGDRRPSSPPGRG